MKSIKIIEVQPKEGIVLKAIEVASSHEHVSPCCNLVYRRYYCQNRLVEESWYHKTDASGNVVYNKKITILFDYIDYVNVVVDKKTTVLRNTVFSKININATTMENHPLNILLNIPFTIGAMSIDNSISTPLKEIKKKKTIDCISKPGQYTLLNMEAKLSSSFIKIGAKLIMFSCLPIVQVDKNS